MQANSLDIGIIWSKFGNILRRIRLYVHTKSNIMLIKLNYLLKSLLK